MKYPLLLLCICLVAVAIPVSGQPAVQSFGMELGQGSGGYLGVYLRDVTADDVTRLGLKEETGVIAERVNENSPASAGGIQDGDVILKYAGIPVFSASQFQRLVADTPPDRKVSIVVWRSGKSQNLMVQVGARPGPTWRVPPERGFSYRMPNLPELHRRPDRDIVIVPRRDKLGVNAAALTDQMADFLGVSGRTGVLVLEVRSGSPGAQAGLKAGDVIVSVNGKTVSDPQELTRSLTGDDVKLEVLRKGQALTLNVKFESEDPSAGDSIRL